MSYLYVCHRCGQTYSPEEYSKDKFCNNCGTSLQKQLQRGTKYWIFQANPSKFRIFDWWDDHPNDNKITWSIRQKYDEVKEGDQGIIWLSGNDSGIYALVEVLSNPANVEHTVEERQYWVKKEELLKISKRAFLWYKKRLFDCPISRDFCIEDDVLTTMSIIKQAQGTVFKLSKSHMNIDYKFS